MALQNEEWSMKDGADLYSASQITDKESKWLERKRHIYSAFDSSLKEILYARMGWNSAKCQRESSTG